MTTACSTRARVHACRRRGGPAVQPPALRGRRAWAPSPAAGACAWCRVHVRNLDGHACAIRTCAPCRRKPGAPRADEVPFVVARILWQDSPACRSCGPGGDALGRRARGEGPRARRAAVSVDQVVDHSVQVDRFAAPTPTLQPGQGVRAQPGPLRVSQVGHPGLPHLPPRPPGIGICTRSTRHLAPDLQRRGDVYFTDSLVGTDSHTTMINGSRWSAGAWAGIEPRRHARPAVYF
jgi:aconitate hydratase